MHSDDTCPDGAVRIPLYAKDGSIRAYALIDAADADWVNQWRWSLHVCGTTAYAGRARRTDGRASPIRLHRVLLGLEPGDRRWGDHINRDTLDNRRANLRIVLPRHGVDNQTPQKDRTSNYRGVSWNRQRGIWVANIKVQGRQVYLGGFEDERQAAERARAARLTLLPYATD